MEFHLDNEIFNLVTLGTKNVEIRLNDEKRRKLKVGDTITFTKRPENIEKVNAKIVALKYVNSFSELSKIYPMKRLYNKEYSFNELLTLLNKFYTKEDEQKYGVVAIEFSLIK